MSKDKCDMCQCLEYEINRLNKEIEKLRKVIKGK